MKWRGLIMRRKQILISPIILLVSLLIINIFLPLSSEAKAANDTYGYTNLGICNSQDENVIIYEKPSEDSKAVGVLPYNAGCEVIYNAGEWIYVSSGEVDGFVSAKYLYVGNKAWDKAVSASEYIVTGKKDDIKIRKSANVDGEILYNLQESESLCVVDDTQNQRWIKVQIGDETFGYVKSTEVDIDYTLKTAISENDVTRRAKVTK